MGRYLLLIYVCSEAGTEAPTRPTPQNLAGPKLALPRLKSPAVGRSANCVFIRKVIHP